jgi:hypothetical protein
MADSYEGLTSLSEIQVNEEHWGQGAEPVVKAWLRENYDPETMPRLQVASIKEREGVWLLGWAHEGTEYESLLSTIFGEGYATAVLDQVNAGIRDRERGRRGHMCPRCGIGSYLPYSETWREGDPAPPALSRTDNRTYVCSSCGTDEAMQDHMEGRLSPQEEWPLIPPGTFGSGKSGVS